jgi:hypothetical protein
MKKQANQKQTEAVSISGDLEEKKIVIDLLLWILKELLDKLFSILEFRLNGKSGCRSK